jgi:glycosyltransferase involved in cell wall biosynthesis
MTGIQVHVTETIAALARTRTVRLKALVPADLSPDVARSLESWPGVQLVTHAEARQLRGERADVVHRPYQINNAGELTFLTQLADRLVITHQDLISYFNPSYFPSLEEWEQYRQLTRGALAIADRVLFVSDHARRDALAEELVEPHRASVVHNGVHRAAQGNEQPSRPPGTTSLPEHAEVLLCIGTDYHHKNRIFALRVLEQLQQRHAWTGCLVFAGPTVRQGSSRAQEMELVAGRPSLARSVITCPAVSESEKAWLYARARLVLYPTVHEGFGLVPFEAAEHEVPCMWAPGTALSELLPEAAAPILPWDAGFSADRAIELLRDEELRRRNISAIREAGAALTWDATALRLLELYEQTCDAPATPASGPERRHGRISEALTEDSMRLIGPGGALPPDVERPLLALATHPRIGAPVFGALKLGYRTSYKLRRWRGRDGSAQPAVVEDAHSRR